MLSCIPTSNQHVLVHIASSNRPLRLRGRFLLCASCFAGASFRELAAGHFFGAIFPERVGAGASCTSSFSLATKTWSSALREECGETRPKCRFCSSCVCLFGAAIPGVKTSDCLFFFGAPGVKTLDGFFGARVSGARTLDRFFFAGAPGVKT